MLIESGGVCREPTVLKKFRGYRRGSSGTAVVSSDVEGGWKRCGGGREEKAPGQIVTRDKSVNRRGPTTQDAAHIEKLE